MATGMEMMFANAVKLIIAKLPDEEKQKLAGAIETVLSFGDKLALIQGSLNRIEALLKEGRGKPW